MTRRTLALTAAAVLGAGVVTGGVVVVAGTRSPAVAAAPAPAGTAPVQRRTLSAIVSQAGILGYRARSDGSPYTVINQARGTYTQLPALGGVIDQGRVLYRVNDRPVVLLHGSLPAYRTLSPGATGADVAELNADLVALGYATSAQLHPRVAWLGPASTRAVKKLQSALGVAPTGTLALGQVVFEPTAVRVTTLSVALGGGAAPGQTVLQATSTVRQVRMAVDASQQTEVAVGNTVSVTLPDNRTAAGVVSSVATVARCPPSSGPGGTAPAAGAPGADACSSGGSGGSPTVAVTIALSGRAVTGTWDQAPVQVGITTARVSGALTVPVTALVARAGGDYAVELVGAGATVRLVPVTLGLFDDADGLVQVTGSGLAAGQRVAVPAT